MSFFQSLTEAVRGAYCTALNASGAVFALLDDAISFGSVGPFPVDPAAAIRQGLSVGSGLLCNTPPPSTPPVLFQGGQCPGVNYRVVFNNSFDQAGFSGGECTSTPSTSQLEFVRVGPISVDIARVSRPPVSPGCPDRENVDVLLNNSRVFGPDGTVSGSFSTDITVTRLDGMPDDCGDGPIALPPVPPQIPDGIPIPIEFVDEEGNNISLSPNLFFGNLFVDANAQVNVPIRVEFENNLSIGGELNINTGDINFRLGDDIPSDKLNCPPVPDDSVPDPPEEEELSLNRIVAVRVITTGNPRNSGLLQVPQSGGNPDVIGRDAGLVSFLCPSNASGGGQAWTTDLRVKTFNQVIECPIPWGAIRVRGTARPGLTQQLVAIRASLPLATFPS